jgi:hypothetical protein
MLLQQGADINSQDCHGYTVLSKILCTQQQCSSDTKKNNAQFLLDDCHANFLTIKNMFGKTGWDYPKDKEMNIFLF